MKNTQMKIEGMSCGGCLASTERALKGVSGVRAVTVNLPAGRATVEHDGTVKDRDLLAAVTDAGFEAQIEGN